MQAAFNASNSSYTEGGWRRWIWPVVGLAVIGALLYYYASPKEAATVTAMFTGPGDLSKSTALVDQTGARLFFERPEGTFQGFFYVNTLNRTGRYAPCGTGAGQASCADGTFGPCACEGAGRNDCTACKHKGYETLVSIAGVAEIEVLTVPDASRQGQAMAQLVLKTQGPATGAGATGTQTYVETVPLPQIPMQKWIMITVSREGRRFDVYYNKSLVVSKKSMYMPITASVDSNLSGVMSGSANLAGEVALVDLENRRYTMGEVASSYARKCDTRGTPYVSSQFSAGYRDTAGLLPNHSDSLLGTFLGATASVSICPEGGCLNMPAVRPPSGLYDWTTGYA